ncbi:MAG TPA: hypothetical protein EYH53_01385 [Methanothermococcus okinawensis]|nr:hypothetical protein [Methanothermococcus okinawensis]
MTYKKEGNYEEFQDPLTDLNVGTSIVKLQDKSIFNKKIKVYYGVDKHYVAKQKFQDENRPNFLKNVYKTFPYNYPDKRDPQTDITFCVYYTFEDFIDEDILKLLELEKIDEYSWDDLDPHIATRLLTSYVKSSYNNLNSILTSYKSVKVELKEENKEMDIPVTQKFEIRTIGYDHFQGEITLGIMRRSSIDAIPLYIFKELDELSFWSVLRTLKTLAKESVESNYRKVRIYSETQPKSGTAAVVDIKLGSRSIKNHLKKHEKGAVYLKRKLKELGKSLDDVSCLLIAVYDNKVSLEMAKKDEDRYCYYFTEYNAYLVLTPEVQESLFKKFDNDWISIVKEYKKKLQEISSLDNFNYHETFKGVPVNLKEDLMVRTYQGLYSVNSISKIFKNYKILRNMLPICPDILKETKRHKLQIFIFCPEDYTNKIYRTSFYWGLNQFKEGLFSNTFASVDDIEVVPVRGESPRDYREVMRNVGFDSVKDYTLGVVIFPECYKKRDIQLKEFYNWLKRMFYSENKPLVFQGARINSIFNGRDAKYAFCNLLLQIPPKLGIYPYSLKEHLEYNYIIGIDYTYWHERDTISLGGGAVIVSPSGIIEDIYPVVIPSNAESLDMTKILEEWFIKVAEKNKDILDRDRITLLISRDGRIPKYERQTIQEFLSEFSKDMDIKVEAVEVRKRIAVRTWSTEKVAYYSPVKVGKYTHYLVDAHTGYSIKKDGKPVYYYSSPYIIGNYYSFEKGKNSPTLGNPRERIIHSLIRLQKINYATTRMDNIKLPLPLSITHKLIEFIRDTEMKIRKIGIPHSLFMI